MPLPPGLVVAHANSPYVTLYDQEGDTFTKITSPGGLTSTAQKASFSNDGNYLGVVFGGGFQWYERSGDTYNLLTLPDTRPGSSGRDIHWTRDSNYLAVAGGTGPYFYVYKRDTNALTSLSVPGYGGAPINGARWSHDGLYLAFVADSGTTRLHIIKRDGDSLTIPTGAVDTDLSSYGFRPGWSSDDVYLAVPISNSPYIHVYKRSGDTFTRLANPDVLPPNSAYQAAFSPDGLYLAVAHNSSPFITIYKRDGDTFTKLANPPSIPGSRGESVAWSDDSSYLAWAGYSTKLRIWKNNFDDTFTKLADPTMPPNDSFGVAFTPLSPQTFLSGTVTENGTPVARTVRAYRRDTGALLAETVSAGGSEVVTWNPDDKHANYTLTNSDLTATLGTSSVWSLLRTTVGKSSGKWYFEVFVDNNPGSGRFEVGIGSTAVPLQSEPGAHAGGWVWLNNTSPSARNGATGHLYGNTYWTTGDVIGCAVDFVTGMIWWSLNGTWYGDPAAGTGAPFSNVAGTLYPLMATNWTGGKGTLRAKTADLTYTPPAGFSAWEAEGDGSFSIDTGTYTGECQVVVLDDDAGTAYNALIQGRVVPVSG